MVAKGTFVKLFQDVQHRWGKRWDEVKKVVVVWILAWIQWAWVNYLGLGMETQDTLSKLHDNHKSNP
jgi:hypothetical protein